MACPAAAPGRRRRPAASDPGDGGGRPLGEEWKKADALAMETIAGWKTVQAKGSYWEEAAEVAGNLVEVRLSGGQREVVIRVTGTNCEAVLKAMSADAKREMVLHLCPDPCPVKAWSDNLMHISEIKEVELDSLAWGRCLLDHREGTAGEEDELSRLRREADEMRDRGKGRGDTAVGGEVMAPPGDPGGAKTDKDEEKKRRKKKKRKKVKIEGTKELSVIYGKTGRRRIRKRARKITDRGKSKKRSSSSDSEESSSSTSGASLEGDQELFEAPTPVQQVWKKYPGSLTSAMVAEARQSLLVQLGGHSLSSSSSHGIGASRKSLSFIHRRALASRTSRQRGVQGLQQGGRQRLRKRKIQSEGKRSRQRRKGQRKRKRKERQEGGLQEVADGETYKMRTGGSPGGREGPLEGEKIRWAGLRSYASWRRDGRTSW